MKYWIALVLSMFLLTACSPGKLSANYQHRKAAEEQARGADAMALVTVGDSLPSYEVGGSIYTDTHVSVIRGRNVTTGAKITLRREGGSVPTSGTTAVRVLTVDYSYFFPPKGDEVFLLLKRIGDKFEIIDAMALEGGRPVQDQPSNQVYLSYLKKLK